MPTFEFVYVGVSHEGKLGEVQRYLSWAISLTLVLQHKSLPLWTEKALCFQLITVTEQRH